jgi:hypothetical protein
MSPSWIYAEQFVHPCRAVKLLVIMCKVCVCVVKETGLYSEDVISEPCKSHLNEYTRQ